MLTNFSRELEINNRLETNFLRILYYEFSEKFSDIYRSYEYTRLCTIINGKKQVSINNQSNFSYDQNQFILLPPFSNVHMTIEEPTRAVVFELNSQLIKDVSEKISQKYEIDYNSLVKDQVFFSKDSRKVKANLNKINHTLFNSGDNKEFFLDLQAQELVYNLIQIKGAHQLLMCEYDNPIHKAVNYMKNNCTRSFSIRQLSYDLYMSEANFCQYFKKIIGISPKAYLTHLILTKARELLEHCTVTEVAFSLGYENISHFISIFKEKYGITPKQYQKERKNLNSGLLESES